MEFCFKICFNRNENRKLTVEGICNLKMNLVKMFVTMKFNKSVLLSTGEKFSSSIYINISFITSMNVEFFFYI